MTDQFLSLTTKIKHRTPSLNSSWVLILMLLFFQISCETDSVVSEFCADPLGSDNLIYKNGNVFCFKNDFNGCFTLDLTTTKTFIRAVNYVGKELAMIQDMGQVKCLSEVNTKPASGYVYTVNALLNHGYSIKLPDGTYGRLFIDSWTKSASGVVLEINITRQYSY
jgi:hypothetical protein